MTTENQNLTQAADQDYYEPSSEELLELVAQVQSGNQEAKNTLCKYFTPAVEATARSYSIYNVLGEDGISMGWIIFFECLENIDLTKTTQLSAGYFKTILSKRLINEVKEAFRYNNHHVYEDTSGCEAIIKDFEDSLVKDLDAKPALQALKQALLALKPKELEFIYWHYYEELSLMDMAQLRNIPVARLWSFKYRITQKLRKHFYHYYNS